MRRITVTVNGVRHEAEVEERDLLVYFLREGLGLTGTLETNTKEDMGAHASFILLWGANLASQPNTGRRLAAAKRRGARVVTIDVRETEAAALSDETFLLRPGTESALALGMMHVIVGEKL